MGGGMPAGGGMGGMPGSKGGRGKGGRAGGGPLIIPKGGGGGLRSGGGPRSTGVWAAAGTAALATVTGAADAAGMGPRKRTACWAILQQAHIKQVSRKGGKKRKEQSQNQESSPRDLEKHTFKLNLFATQGSN